MFNKKNAVRQNYLTKTIEENEKVGKKNSNDLPDYLKETEEEQRLKMKGVSIHEIEGMKQKEKINLMTYVNCLKHLSPILQKVSVLDGELQAEYIYSHTLNANQFALKVMEGLMISPLHQKWMVNVLERIYSETFIQNNNPTDIDFKVPVDKLIKYIKRVINEGEFQEQEFIEIDNLNIKIQMAQLSCMSDALSCYQTFNFFIDEDRFLEEYYQFLQKETKKWFEIKVKDNSLLKPEDKVIFYLSLIKEINIAFIETWKKEARSFLIKFRSLAEHEQEQWHKENNMGYDIFSLFKMTQERIQKLFNLVGIVIPLRNKF